MSIVVTGARGQLGDAVLRRLRAAKRDVVPWSRPEYDLDTIGVAEQLIERDQPDIVIHAAAWTDADGCAAQPASATRRNGRAVAELAAACAPRGVRLVVVSCHQVFSGRRTDGSGYTESDLPNPATGLGASKYGGEQAARTPFLGAGRTGNLLIVRLGWLFGRWGYDGPSRFIAMADRLADGAPLEVTDETVVSPTYAPDAAAAIVRLLDAGAPGGIYHVSNRGRATVGEVAAYVLGRVRPGRAVAPADAAPADAAPRQGRPANVSRWWAMDTSVIPSQDRLRGWQEAMDDYLRAVSESRTNSARRLSSRGNQ